MRKFILSSVTALSLIAVAVGMAVASPPASGSTTVKATKVVVGMHDPGCHWFLKNGAYTKTDAVHGAVKLVNVDEKTLIIAPRD